MINTNSSNFLDSPISYMECNSIKINDSYPQNPKNEQPYLRKNSENSYEFEELKELKFDVYSTEESKNNSNKFNQIQNNNENDESLEIKKNSSSFVTKEQILDCFFTCKLCKKILYSPFICKNCGESACHSCFGKSNKNQMIELRNKNKKLDNKKFNFCKFCKNENVTIMPNFKVLQLKEDINKNIKS